MTRTRPGTHDSSHCPGAAPARRRRAVSLSVTLCAIVVTSLAAILATAQSGQPPAPAKIAVPLRFQFGVDASPLAAGFTLVTDRTIYSHKRGYGWRRGDEGVARDRERGEPLRRSLNFGSYIEFLVDLPNGAYDLTVTMGDQTSAHDEMGLLLQGKRVDSVTTAAGEFHVGTYRVSVTAGQLSVVLDDLGGENLDAVINGLEIAPVAAKQ
jgi:large repetitive protein